MQVIFLSESMKNTTLNTGSNKLAGVLIFLLNEKKPHTINYSIVKELSF